jgi:predicted Zn finger-like uncharacterized protein
VAMVTRCPECSTAFKVAPEQLQMRHGQVRCGRCKAVFDGFQALSTEAEMQPAAGAAEPPVAAPAVPVPVSPPALDVSTETREPSVEPIPAVIALKDGSAPAKPVAPLVVASDEDEEVSTELPARRKWPWAVGTAFLLVLLAGQAAYAYRSELAAGYPALKPLLVRACDAAGCKVPLPQRPRLINIEASDLQSVDPARPQVIQLTATLRNHAGFEVGYPALDLVLTNTKEHTLARRIFLPEDYMGRTRDARTGIPANAEVTIRLDLDTGDLGAAGFRLDLLPAPAR